MLARGHRVSLAVRYRDSVSRKFSWGHGLQILTCQHCRTKVAVSSESICPSCRKPTTDVPLPIVEELPTLSRPKTISRPDTIMNRVFMIASLICAVLQIVSLIRHSVTHHQPGSGLDQFSGFVELWITVAVALPLQVLGSAFGLGAGNMTIYCIVWNIACCGICILLSLII